MMMMQDLKTCLANSCHVKIDNICLYSNYDGVSYSGERDIPRRSVEETTRDVGSCWFAPMIVVVVVSWTKRCGSVRCRDVGPSTHLRGYFVYPLDWPGLMRICRCIVDGSLREEKLQKRWPETRQDFTGRSMLKKRRTVEWESTGKLRPDSGNTD